MSEMNVRTMAQMAASGEKPDVLFWVGCAGSFDDRAKKITKAFVKLLNNAGVDFAVLGTEESWIIKIQACTHFALWRLGKRRCLTSRDNDLEFLRGREKSLQHS